MLTIILLRYHLQHFITNFGFNFSDKTIENEGSTLLKEKDTQSQIKVLSQLHLTVKRVSVFLINLSKRCNAPVRRGGCSSYRLLISRYLSVERLQVNFQWNKVDFRPDIFISKPTKDFQYFKLQADDRFYTEKEKYPFFSSFSYHT